MTGLWTGTSSLEGSVFQSLKKCHRIWFSKGILNKDSQGHKVSILATIEWQDCPSHDFLKVNNWKNQNVPKSGIFWVHFDSPKMGSDIAITVLLHSARDISKRIPMIILPWEEGWESHWVWLVLGIECVFIRNIPFREDESERTLFWQREMVTQSFTLQFWILSQLWWVCFLARITCHFIKCQPGLLGLEREYYISHNILC